MHQNNNRLSREVQCGYQMTAGHDKPSPRSGDEMTNANKLPEKKLLGFSASHDSVEAKLLSWIRGIVQSNDQLVDALEHLQRSYKVLQTGKSVPDAAEILWQVGGCTERRAKIQERPCIESSPGVRTPKQQPHSHLHPPIPESAFQEGDRIKSVLRVVPRPK
jgi:hypothetical protein